VSKRKSTRAPRNTSVKHVSRHLFRGKVAVDFDGVLHDYSRGWTGYVPVGKPIEGAIQFILDIEAKGFEPVIFSARADTIYGENCIRDWLKKWGFPTLRIFPKLNCIAFVDDRGVHCDPAMGGEQDGFEWALNEVQRLADVRREYPAPLPIERKVTKQGRVDYSYLTDASLYPRGKSWESMSPADDERARAAYEKPDSDDDNLADHRAYTTAKLDALFADGLRDFNPMDDPEWDAAYEGTDLAVWDDDGALVQPSGGRYPWDRS
jgi:hypothetical protein